MFLPHPQGSEDCPVPLPKTVRRTKGFKEAYSTDEVARQTCPVFGSSTLVGATKTPPVPLFPSARGFCIKSNVSKKHESRLLQVVHLLIASAALESMF